MKRSVPPARKRRVAETPPSLTPRNGGVQKRRAAAGLALFAVAAAVFLGFRLGRLFDTTATDVVPGGGARTAAASSLASLAPDLQRPPGSEVPVQLNPNEPPGPAPEGMVWIPGGDFWMGTDDPTMPDARPIHRVNVDGFWIDRTEVTNAQFAAFVAATGYQTVAERFPDPRDYPGADPGMLVPGSIVFNPPRERVSLDNAYQWWAWQPGASWRHPEGPMSSIADRMDHPAVHIAWEDAHAYAQWAGKAIPTEAQWEFAARGGLDRKRYGWGDEFQPQGHFMANTWQGTFPAQNEGEDGFVMTAPVGKFPPNGYGLFDMAGNVWEWCADWYRPDYFQRSPYRNPAGPVDSFDPNEPGIPKRVQKGGSLMCTDQYCTRYIPGGRGKGAIDSGQPHVGFRCVLAPDQGAPAGAAAAAAAPADSAAR